MTAEIFQAVIMNRIAPRHPQRWAIPSRCHHVLWGLGMTVGATMGLKDRCLNFVFCVVGSIPIVGGWQWVVIVDNGAWQAWWRSSASGLVVKSNVAIVGPRVRFSAGACMHEMMHPAWCRWLAYLPFTQDTGVRVPVPEFFYFLSFSSQIMQNTHMVSWRWKMICDCKGRPQRGGHVVHCTCLFMI